MNKRENTDAWSPGQPSYIPLANLRWHVDARHVSLLQEGLADDVHDELFRGPNIRSAILEPAGWVCHADGDHRGTMRHLLQ